LTLRAILQVAENMAARRPLVLSVEDVHWIDPTSSQLLDRLMAGVPGMAVLLLVTFRPELTPPWSAPQGTMHLTLGRLERGLTARLIGHVTRGKPLPDDLETQLIARSEGNPLFVEELTKAVLESGFVEEENDRFVLVGPLQSFGIPVTLQESLLARLDRLAPIKEVAQFAAAIGRDFLYDLLAEIVPLTRGQLQEALDCLAEAGLISRLPGSPATYSFKHALVRDAAYDSILHRRRHQLHGLIAEALRAGFAATIEQNPELLALHLTYAGLYDQAVEAWLHAGLRAIERSATLEAVAHLRKGLELIAHLPDGQPTRKHEVRLQTALGAALRATQGFAAPVVAEAFERARLLCAALDDEELLLDVLPGLQSYYHVHGQLREARELGGQLIALASGRSEPHRLLDARRRMGWSLFWLGELAEAGDFLEGALALYDPKDHQLHIRLYGDHPGVFAYCNLAWVRWAQGRTSEADRHTDVGLRLAEEVDHVLSLAYGMCVMGALYAARRDADSARALATRAIQFVEDKGFPYWTAWAHIVHGWALTQIGAPEEGLAELSQGIDDYAATGGELVRPYALGLLGDSLSGRGEYERAVVALDEAIERAQEKSIGFYVPELLRLKGCSLLASGTDGDEGLECLRRAVDLASAQGAYSLQLRAANALARALLDAGRRAEARELIVPTRARCPESQITPELRAADELIAELGPG
jgi:tetratricopeptide (TPR) repeat protein